MFYKEAEQINKILADFQSDQINPIIEIGSSTSDFRETKKPHINKFIHQYLSLRNIRIYTSDLKSGAGIDLSGDIFEESFSESLRLLNPKMVLCCNILEHVKNPELFAKIVSSLIQRNCHIICSVPLDYPYHPDPIDNLLRPSPDEIAQLFHGTTLISSWVISGDSYKERLLSMGISSALFFFLKEVIRFIFLLFTLRYNKALNTRIFWLNKRFKTSLVLLRKDR